MEQGADLVVSSLLQTIIIRCLPMLEGIAADVVERITVGQLGLPEQVVLLRRRDEFQFGGDDLLHTLVHPEQAPSRLPVLATRFTAGLGLHLPHVSLAGMRLRRPCSPRLLPPPCSRD